MLGLGACWLGVHPREKRVEHISKLFSLPPSVIPVSCIALGKPAELKDARTRYRDEAAHYELW
jgi:nitroreductase